MLETDKKILGLKFKQYRKNKKLTQFELAEKIGLNEKQISRIEAGLNYPTYVTFAKLVEALEMDISDFFKNNEQKNSESKQKIIRIINNSEEFELKMYHDVIKAIRKNIC